MPSSNLGGSAPDSTSWLRVRPPRTAVRRRTLWQRSGIYAELRERTPPGKGRNVRIPDGGRGPEPAHWGSWFIDGQVHSYQRLVGGRGSWASRLALLIRKMAVTVAAWAMSGGERRSTVSMLEWWERLS